MAKRRGRDLFEILGARAQGVRPTGKRSSVTAGDGLSAAVEWFRGLLPQTGRPAKISGRRGAAVGGRSGLLITALAFVLFGAGFAVGRGTSGSAVSAEQLRRDATETRRGADPEWVAGERRQAATGGSGAVLPLDRDGEEAALSTFGFGLVWYPAPQRQKAARLAAWLRDQGLTTTRLRSGIHKDTGDPIFLVVCYTDESGTRERSLLESLDEPGFAVGLGEVVGRLPAKPSRFQSP